MMWTYPAIEKDGWHAEAGWSWDTFGVIASLTVGSCVALRLGWAYVMLWKFDSKPRDLNSEVTGMLHG